MITRRLLMLFSLMISMVVAQGQNVENKKVSVKEFTDNPWPFAPYYEVIQGKYSKVLKTEKYTKKSAAFPSRKDTIFRLSKGKTEIFFFRPYKGKPQFIAANLYDERIKLKGDISAGISSSDFYSKIAFPDVGKDSVRINLPDSPYGVLVVMKKNKVHHIKIEVRSQRQVK